MKNNFFDLFAKKTSELIGSPIIFFIALIIILFWLTSGILFNFSDTWQLVMNTISSVITFIIVFVIQDTQNRETKIMQIKLDELIKSHKTAKNTTIDIDKLSNKELKILEDKYKELCKK